MSMRDVKRALSDIFKLAAHSLESLSILDLNALSFRPFELKKILDSLPGIRELKLSGVDKKHQNALVDTLPHLHALTLAFVEDETNATPFLKAPKSDLQTVTLCNGTFEDASISLPTVHTLRACPLEFPSEVDAYTRIFPNVHDVTLDFPRDYGHMDADFRRRMRSYNLSTDWATPYAQSWRDEFLNRPKKKHDAWPHLQSLRAAGDDAAKLSWAGLTCQVARVETGCWRLWKEQLARMLNELRPRAVVFHPGSFHGPWKGELTGLGQLLALQDAPFVTRLAVVLCRGITDHVRQAVWLVRWALQNVVRWLNCWRSLRRQTFAGTWRGALFPAC